MCSNCDWDWDGETKQHGLRAWPSSWWVKPGISPGLRRFVFWYVLVLTAIGLGVLLPWLLRVN